jgi:hypothetical protein
MSRNLVRSFAAAVLAAATLGSAAYAGDGDIDTSKYPAEQKARYPLFQQKCSKCHPYSRATTAKFGAGEWKHYMKRMVRRPDSGISEDQAEEVLKFLQFYASQG